jgi:hypothetical protein
MYLHVNLVGTGGYLFVFQMDMAFAIYYYLTIENGNTLVLNAPAPAGTGIWKWAITPGIHRIAIRYIFDTATTNVPVCFIDGILQTPIESAQPTTQSYAALRQLVVGGYRAGFSWYQDWASYCFTGSIGEIALCNQLHSNSVMARYTNPATLKKAVRFAPGVVNYWPCDELPDGQTGIQEIYAHPSSDVNTLWSTKSLATYWESVLNDDTNYIRATSSDPIEEQRLAFSGAGFIKPAGTEVIAMGITIKNADPSYYEQPFTVAVKKGANWYAMPYSVYQFNSGTTEGTTKEVLLTRSMGWGDWSQSDLEGLQLGFLTNDMTDKSAKVTFNYMYVTVYCGQWGDQFRDYVGGNHLVNRNALGRAERKLSYL